jgi:hypothetical protein
MKVLLDQSCFDRNGYVILGTVTDAIQQAIGAERVKFGNKFGKFPTTRPWTRPSTLTFHRINGRTIGKDFKIRIIDVSIRERWNVEVESKYFERIRWCIQQGKLKPLDCETYLRIEQGRADTVVSLDQLNECGATIGDFEFERAQVADACVAGDQSADTSSIQNKKEWISKAIELASLYLESWRNAGFAPSVLNAANYCEDMLYQHGYFGRNGKGDKLLAANIKRTALDGEKLGGKKGGTSKLPKIPNEKVRTMPF